MIGLLVCRMPPLGTKISFADQEKPKKKIRANPEHTLSTERKEEEEQSNRKFRNLNISKPSFSIHRIK